MLCCAGANKYVIEFPVFNDKSCFQWGTDTNQRVTVMSSSACDITHYYSHTFGLCECEKNNF